MTAIWWVRRDLRLSDNPALQAALRHGGQLVPVFILDPHLLNRTPAHRQAFLFENLRCLDGSLRQRGSALVIRAGRPEIELLNLLMQTSASAIFAEEDFTPYARSRDDSITRMLPLTLIHGQTVHHPLVVHKADGKPYTVFTPFSKAWKALLPADLTPLPTPNSIPPHPLFSNLQLLNTGASNSISVSHLEPRITFPAGEQAAMSRLENFIASKLSGYSQDRNRLDLDGTSALSPYIRFGVISIRQAACAAIAAASGNVQAAEKRSAGVFLNELIWREFYTNIFYHFPQVGTRAFKPAMQNISWRNNASEFDAWKNGQTGVPVVDAAMRQLHVTGWMHNRARMIVASFLVKDLLINWQWGERWFMDNLLDGDPAVNNGGWQWIAGTGTDSAPYFRIFNPVIQGQKFDPDGVFIRRFVPELQNVPAKYIHTPWEMPEELQSQVGCIIGRDYCAPIVNHGQARQRVLSTYRQLAI